MSGILKGIRETYLLAAAEKAVRRSMRNRGRRKQAG